MKTGFWDETPTLSTDQVDVFVHDAGCVSRTHAPRQNNERPRVRWHDFRSRAERTKDPRTAKEIAKTHPNNR